MSARCAAGVRWLYAEQARGVGIVAADHVAIEHRDDLRQRHHRMRRVIARAEQPALFGAVKHDQDRALGRLPHERARGRKHGHTHAAIVVGTGPDRILADNVAHAVVILV